MRRSEVQQRLRVLPEALVDFYAPGLESSSYVERAFTLTSRLLQFDLNSYGVMDPASGQLTADFDVPLPGLGASFAAYGRLMKQYQPFRFDPTCNGGKPFSAVDFYSPRAFEDLDIFQEVYRPMRLVDHCFVHVPTPPGEVVFMGFLRGGRAFDADEKSLVGLLQGHLANGRSLARAVSVAREHPLSPELFSRKGFTPRESDVLFGLTQGHTTRELAKQLGLRSDSVRRHLHAIYEKLGVDHRAAATLRALALAREPSAERPRGNPVLSVATR